MANMSKLVARASCVAVSKAFYFEKAAEELPPAALAESPTARAERLYGKGLDGLNLVSALQDMNASQEYVQGNQLKELLEMHDTVGVAAAFPLPRDEVTVEDLNNAIDVGSSAPDGSLRALIKDLKTQDKLQGNVDDEISSLVFKNADQDDLIVEFTDGLKCKKEVSGGTDSVAITGPVAFHSVSSSFSRIIKADFAILDSGETCSVFMDDWDTLVVKESSTSRAKRVHRREMLRESARRFGARSKYPPLPRRDDSLLMNSTPSDHDEIRILVGEYRNAEYQWQWHHENLAKDKLLKLFEDEF